MIKFINIGSGSKGNGTLFYNDKDLILVDYGLTLETLNNALSLINKTINDIEAVFITHDHSDHIKSLIYLPDEMPVYAGLSPLIKHQYTVIKERHPITVGSFTVMPCRTSHDASYPLGFIISDEDTKFGYVTDTGRLTKTTIKALSNCDYYIFEANHDPQMLSFSNRPLRLINRIRSIKGHLNNENSAKYLLKIIGPHTKKVYLAHLSEECNTPALALETEKEVFRKAGVEIPDNFFACLKQWEMTKGPSDED